MSKNKSQSDQVDQIKSMLDEIVKQANDLRDHGYTALDQSTGAVAAGVAKAQKDAVTRLNQLKQDKAQMRGENADGWQKVQNNFHNFFANSRIEHDERAIKSDIKNAEKRAENADNNAANAVKHAMSALQAAEVALLDDIQAWSYAEELSADMKA